jgi:hypothetical protein
MELVLDDVVRVLKGLVLSGQGIGGMKELIDSILHGQPMHARLTWSLHRQLTTAFLVQNTPKQQPTRHVHRPSLALISTTKWRQSCASIPLSFLLSFF